MPLYLKNRDQIATELMDDPECNHDALITTYRQFSTINSLITRWKSIYREEILPFAAAQNRTVSLLDIGFGGGDIPRKLSEWASEDGINLQVTGIDTDERAYGFVQDLSFPDAVTFRLASSSTLVDEGCTFDFVISNHLIHHLMGQNFFATLEDARKLSTHRVLFNDIERSDIGYLMFNLLSRVVFRSSFITHDGLTSIKRSYTYQELENKVPEGWKVSRIFPYRLLLSYRHA